MTHRGALPDPVMQVQAVLLDDPPAYEHFVVTTARRWARRCGLPEEDVVFEEVRVVDLTDERTTPGWRVLRVSWTPRRASPQEP